MRSDEQMIWYHLVTVGSLLVFKLTVLLVGYLIAKLGHDLLIRGVSGEFKFHSEMKGGKADLVSASPGLFFILMAAALIAIGVIKDKPFETTITRGSVVSGGERLPNTTPGDKPNLPPNPVQERKP